jgi:hypothetical protein
MHASHATNGSGTKKNGILRAAATRENDRKGFGSTTRFTGVRKTDHLLELRFILKRKSQYLAPFMIVWVRSSFTSGLPTCSVR